MVKLLRPKRFVSSAKHFFELEASGGILLVIAAALALIVANSPLYDLYDYILNEVLFRIGFTDAGSLKFAIEKPVLLWINDGLMAIFFFLVGLEIKRELLDGELSKPENAILPAFGAVGGIAVPALIFVWINMATPENMPGWAIPAATDIAFALGVLSLLGSRAPTSLKVLLTAIAIIDDLAAIIIIAVFYSDTIIVEALGLSAIAIAALAYLNLKGVSKLSPYMVITIILWICVLKSGVHATLAGVVAALCIPMKSQDKNDEKGYSPLKHLEHSLHPWVAFLVLPIFGFANAGVPFAGLGRDALMDPLTLGIAGGLFIGKQIGIFALMALAIILGLSPKPKGAGWVQLYGVSLLCGIGFTMSLFIGGLAFDGTENQAAIRLGVLAGSIGSAVLGYSLLRFAPLPVRAKSKKKA